MLFDEKINRLNTNSIKWDRYKNPEIIAMGTADMDFKSPGCVTQALIERAKVGMFAYEFKSDSYYQAIINWYKRRYNWDLRKEWIANSPGIWAGMRMCVDTFTKLGDKIIVSSPYYHPVATIIEKSGREMITSSLILNNGKYYMDMMDFESKLAYEKTKMFILINPQNPTGRVFTRDELQQIGEICKKHGVMVVSDEVHANITYDGHVHIPFASVSEDLAMQSIVLAAPSKAFNLQGLTYGILIIPNSEYREMYEETMCGYDFDFATNVFSMRALEAAYSQGEPWLNELNAYLQGNLDYLSNYFETYIPQIKVIRPEGAYMVWLDCRGLGMQPAQLQHLFYDKAKVALTGGENFGTDGEGFQRINIACARSLLEEALKRIRHIIGSL
ncbi:Cystathionine beta-lyase PatB [Sporomusa rhizae]|uniref:MalY/PatB family protein n=1 Tax=Sporomusa rhizae TaxID=357999 RepID=UPI00352AFEA3